MISSKKSNKFDLNFAVSAEGVGLFLASVPVLRANADTIGSVTRTQLQLLRLMGAHPFLVVSDGAVAMKNGMVCAGIAPFDLEEKIPRDVVNVDDDSDRDELGGGGGGGGESDADDGKDEAFEDVFCIPGTRAA